MDTLQELQKWYHSQCDGDWEHGYGVEIGTLDNPGWRVSINLAGTPLAEQSFGPVERLGHKTEWIHCQVRDGKFEGHGGPFMLNEILQAFLTWAAETHTA
ncbi:MAG: immunity 53 family protein [Verrucomicrobiota bacterium]